MPFGPRMAILSPISTSNVTFSKIGFALSSYAKVTLESCSTGPLYYTSRQTTTATFRGSHDGIENLMMGSGASRMRPAVRLPLLQPPELESMEPRR